MLHLKLTVPYDSELRIPKAGLTEFTKLEVNLCKIVLFGLRNLYDCTTS